MLERTLDELEKRRRRLARASVLRLRLGAFSGYLREGVRMLVLAPTRELVLQSAPALANWGTQRRSEEATTKKGGSVFRSKKRRSTGKKRRQVSHSNCSDSLRGQGREPALAVQRRPASELLRGRQLFPRGQAARRDANRLLFLMSASGGHQPPQGRHAAASLRNSMAFGPRLGDGLQLRNSSAARLRRSSPKACSAYGLWRSFSVAHAETVHGLCRHMTQHGAPPVVFVELKMMSGDSLCLELGETALIQDLKSEVFRLRGIPPDCQRILQGSKALNDLSEVQVIGTPGSEPLSLVVCLDHILQNLETDSILITIRSLDLLSRLLPAAGSLEVFRSYLTHSHEDVRRTAMRALLRSLRPEETIVLILQGIKDQSGEVRQDAMEALRTYAAAAASTALDCTQAQAEHALRALRAALDGCMDVLVPVRITAVRALQALAVLVVPGVHSPCIAELQARVGDANSLVREEALDALRQLESENVIALGSVAEAVEKLECKDWDTWLWALRARRLSLQERAWKILDRLSVSAAEKADAAEAEAEVLEGISVDLKCDLMVTLRDALREALIEGLQGGSELLEKTFNCVARAFGDSSARVREKAAEVLLVCFRCCKHEAVHAVASSSSYPSPLALLTKGLGDASLGVRERVAEGLSELLSVSDDDEGLGHALLDALKLGLSEPAADSGARNRKAWAISVLAVLERLGPGAPLAAEGLQLAVALLEDPDPEVRGPALVAISKLDMLGTVSSKAVQASFCDPDAAVRSIAWALRESVQSSGDNIDVEAFVSGLVGGSVDCLRDFLHEARPTWSERELSAVLAKLQQVGVKSVAELEQALPRMNTHLSTAGLRCFSRETLSLLRSHLAEKAMMCLLPSCCNGETLFHVMLWLQGASSTNDATLCAELGGGIERPLRPPT